MNSTSLFILFTLLLSGCINRVNGVLTPSQDLVLKGRRNSTIELEKGRSYSASVFFRAKRKIIIKIAGQKVKFKIPRGTQLPTSNGEIYLSPSTTGQEYGLKGRITSKTRRSEQVETMESCLYVDTRVVCRDRLVTTCRRNDYGERECYTNYYYSCQNEVYSLPGTREVSYHYSHNKTTYRLKIINHSDLDVARFKGNKRESQKVYDYRSICLPY